MNNIKKEDLRFGFSNEERVKPILEETFKKLINKNGVIILICFGFLLSFKK